MPSLICSFGFGVSLKKQLNMHVFVSVDCTSHTWHHATSLAKCFPFSWAMSPAVRIEASITETIDYSWSSHGYSNAWSVSLTFCAGSLWADDCFSLVITSRAAGTQLLAVPMHQEIQKLSTAQSMKRDMLQLQYIQFISKKWRERMLPVTQSTWESSLPGAVGSTRVIDTAHPKRFCWTAPPLQLSQTVWSVR